MRAVISLFISAAILLMVGIIVLGVVVNTGDTLIPSNHTFASQWSSLKSMTGSALSLVIIGLIVIAAGIILAYTSGFGKSGGE